MPTTPTYAFRYPASTNSPNVPLDISNLATDVENYLASFMKRGTISITTDSSGLFSISHGLGVAPTTVMLTPAYINDTVSSVFRPTVGAITSSTIQVVCYRTDNSTRLVTTALGVHWLAIK